MTKDKIFHPKRTLKVAGKLFDLSTATTMGILNLTDDSFYDGGQYVQKEKTLLRIGQMLDEGATIIDIGAYSSRPGALYVSEAKEWNRLEQLLPIVNKEFPKAIVSIDTFRAEIARKSIENGAHIINDISAGEMDVKMFDTIAQLKVPYIMMHMQGTPQNMQINPQYGCYYLLKWSFLVKLGLSLKKMEII